MVKKDVHTETVLRMLIVTHLTHTAWRHPIGRVQENNVIVNGQLLEILWYSNSTVSVNIKKSSKL
jgi:hypothetical protein